MPVLHKMTVKQPYYSLIECEKKTIECRLYDSKRQLVNIGDTIEFSNGDSRCVKTVIGLFRANNFHTLFSHINVNDAGFDTNENANNALQEFYDLSAQNKFGVVGIVLG